MKANDQCDDDVDSDNKKKIETQKKSIDNEEDKDKDKDKDKGPQNNASPPDRNKDGTLAREHVSATKKLTLSEYETEENAAGNAMKYEEFLNHVASGHSVDKMFRGTHHQIAGILKSSEITSELLSTLIFDSHQNAEAYFVGGKESVYNLAGKGLNGYVRVGECYAANKKQEYYSLDSKSNAKSTAKTNLKVKAGNDKVDGNAGFNIGRDLKFDNYSSLQRHGGQFRNERHVVEEKNGNAVPLPYKSAMIKAGGDKSVKEVILGLSFDEKVTLLQRFFLKYGSGMVVREIYGDMGSRVYGDKADVFDQSSGIHAGLSLGGKIVNVADGNGIFSAQSTTNSGSNNNATHMEINYEQGLIETESKPYTPEQFFMALCGIKDNNELMSLYQLFTETIDYSVRLIDVLCTHFGKVEAVVRGLEEFYYQMGSAKNNDLYKIGELGELMPIYQEYIKLRNMIAQFHTSRLPFLIRMLMRDPFVVFHADVQQCIVDCANDINFFINKLKEFGKVLLVHPVVMHHLTLKKTETLKGWLKEKDTVNHNFDMKPHEKCAIVIQVKPRHFLIPSLGLKAMLTFKDPLKTKTRIYDQHFRAGGDSHTREYVAGDYMLGDLYDSSQLMDREVDGLQVGSRNLKLTGVNVSVECHHFKKASDHEKKLTKFINLIKAKGLYKNFKSHGLEKDIDREYFDPKLILDKIRVLKNKLILNLGKLQEQKARCIQDYDTFSKENKDRGNGIKREITNNKHYDLSEDECGFLEDKNFYALKVDKICDDENAILNTYLQLEEIEKIAIASFKSNPEDEADHSFDLDVSLTKALDINIPKELNIERTLEIPEQLKADLLTIRRRCEKQANSREEALQRTPSIAQRGDSFPRFQFGNVGDVDIQDQRSRKDLSSTRIVRQ